MLSIRSNIASFNAQKNMDSVSSSLQKSMERLSSGFRINRAGDDAAGLAISEKLRARSVASCRPLATRATASR